MTGSFGSDGGKTLDQFTTLLESCEAQVEVDPSGYLDDPYIYDLLHGVYQHLCHGMIGGASSGNNFQTPRALALENRSSERQAGKI